jgi:hypothetical protein
MRLRSAFATGSSILSFFEGCCCCVGAFTSWAESRDAFCD